MIELELPEPSFDGGEFQPMPDSRRMEDLMGSGELDNIRSRKGDFWVAIVMLDMSQVLSNESSKGEMVNLSCLTPSVPMR